MGRVRGHRLAAHQVRSQLLDRLAAWQREFDDNFHWDRGWRSAQTRDRWASQAEELAADMRAELGTRAELTVRLWPLPGVSGASVCDGQMTARPLRCR